MTWVAPLGEMKKAPETVKSRMLRDADMNCALGPIEAAPVAYDVVSFLPTQTSSTRLVVLKNEKPQGFLQGAWVAALRASAFQSSSTLRSGIKTCNRHPKTELRTLSWSSQTP